MIIEIALGIVLAVIILALLPAIIGLGMVVAVAALVLGLVGTAILFLWGNPEIAILVAVLTGGWAALFGMASLINRKWRHVDVGETMAVLFMALLLGGATFEIFTALERYSSYPLSIAFVLFMDAVCIVSLLMWNKRRLGEWKAKDAVTRSYEIAEEIVND